MSLDEMIAVLTAAKEGKPIEERLKCTGKPFEPFTFGTWDFHRYEYRVRPAEPIEGWVNPSLLYEHNPNSSSGVNYIKVREIL